jgi:phenylacetate-CoA ligase
MITARLYHRITGRDYAQVLDHLGKVQFWPYDNIREYQFNKLKRLLGHAYLHVPYYQRLFKSVGVTPTDIRNFDDFKALPILTKHIIRENINSLTATNMSKEELIPNATGGSTGEPLHFYKDRQYEVWADAARIRGWYQIAGCEMGDNCALLWGDMKEIKEDFSAFERLYRFCKYGEIPLNAFNLSEERKLAFLKWCQLLKPKLLRGYVTAINDLAIFLDERKLTFPELKGVILCAETVDEGTQSYIERVFHSPSYNSYGGRELSLIGMECSQKNGLHEVSENNYVEFEEINLEGYDNAGELVITNLNNYGMPFIRYKIGDIGIPGLVDSCKCGRGLPLIKRIIGRTTEMFIFGDGTRIAGEMFIHLMKDLPLKEYQFIQASDSTIVLRVKKSDNVRGDLRKRIQQTYQKYLPKNVTIGFEEVDGFEKTATGKLKFVYRQIPS